MILAMFVCILIPFLVFFYSIKIKRTKVFLLGCVVFIVGQVLIRIPTINYLSAHSLIFTRLQMQNPIFYMLLLALSAGLVEQGGNYMVIKCCLKKNRSWKDGIIFGLGHGGIEAFLLVGLPVVMTYFSNGIINIGVTASIERFFAMILHVGLSVLVMKTVKSKKIIYLLVAILIHTLVDSLVGLIPLFISSNSLIIESVLAFISLLLLLYVVSLKKGWEIS